MTDFCFAYIYLDFNKFKVFNDQYGFKKGDEVISHFANFLKQSLANKNVFIGHVGGDDFFSLKRFFEKICETFTKNLEGLYSKTIRTGKNVDITVSISKLMLPIGRKILSPRK